METTISGLGIWASVLRKLGVSENGELDLQDARNACKTTIDRCRGTRVGFSQL